MNKLFPGYYQDNKLDQKLLNKAIVVFEYNLLLDIYKLPKEHADSLIQIIKNAKLDLWIPYCMACQYHLHINEEINSEIAAYQSACKKFGELRSLVDLPLIQLTNKELESVDQFVVENVRRLNAAISDLELNLNGSSFLRKQIADLYKNSVGTEEMDPHPYNVGVLSGHNEVSAIDKRSDFNGSLIDDECVNFGTFEKIVFNSIVGRAKAKKAPVVYIIPPSLSCLYLDLVNGLPTVKQNLQDYFIKQSDGQKILCYTFSSFLDILGPCIGISISDKVKESVERCMSHINQECKYIGNNWFKM